MADNFQVLNAAAATVTFRSTDNGSGVQINMSIPTNTKGTAMVGQAVMATSIPVAIASDQSNLPMNIVQFGGTAVTLGQAVMATSLPVAIASNQSSIPVAGDVASGSSDSGNPVKLGAVGHTAAPTAVGDGQRVNLIADKTGRMVVVGALRNLLATQTASLTTTAETTIINAINATTFADLYGLVLANTGTTASRIDLRYGTGSTIVVTFEVPATDTRGFMVPVDCAIPGSLSTANVSWTAQLTATTNMSITTFYVKNI